MLFVVLYVVSFFHFVVLSLFFFFFKQKTAYEMRISDWSSDVCSSDLRLPQDLVRAGTETGQFGARQTAEHALSVSQAPSLRRRWRRRGRELANLPAARRKRAAGHYRGDGRHRPPGRSRPAVFLVRLDQQRSEEHTSELQSLMRISYAVFCL